MYENASGMNHVRRGKKGENGKKGKKGKGPGSVRGQRTCGVGQKSERLFVCW